MLSLIIVRTHSLFTELQICAAFTFLGFIFIHIQCSNRLDLFMKHSFEQLSRSSMFYLHKMQFAREKFDLSIDYKCQIIHETLYSLLLFNLSKIVNTVENQSCFTFPDHMVFVTVQKVAFYCRKNFLVIIFFPCVSNIKE